MRTRSIIISLAVVFTSCKKGELPVPKHDSGSVVTSSIDMGSNYKYQVYFDLKTNSVVGQNLKTAWDLGFEAKTSGNRIILNASKAMYAYNTGSTDFASITDTAGFAEHKTWDAASGNLDSTAIGNWIGNNEVYIIDRGYSETGVHQGFRKIIFETVNGTEYKVKFSFLNGNGLTELTIPKDDLYNFAFLSFNSASVVVIEPPKADWDLVFTQYIHVFYEPELTTYLVTGCLLNHNSTFSTTDFTTPFVNIAFESLTNYTFTSAINTIGYDWKVFDGSTYSVDPSKNYIVQDREGFHYKLHFIDFYNESGVKGNPKWEFQEL